jgi:hypothetical protein
VACDKAGLNATVSTKKPASATLSSSARDCDAQATYDPRGETEPEEVSMISLLATPEGFRGHHVRFIGYVTIEFEGTAVYLHKEDFDNGIHQNALWLNVHDLTTHAASPREGVHGYFILEGNFDPDRRGHMSAFGGELAKYYRIEPWPGAEIRRLPK